MCFYQPESLPGYSAIFRHPKDELNYCYYLIPCGKPGMCGDVSEADLPRLHNDAIKNDPFISRSLGPNAKIERMRAAPLRLGSQGVPQSYGEHLLIIGDAAGHIDPLTGEGIHTAIQGGKIAGGVLADMKQGGDFSSKSTRVWEQRWFEAFGHDFKMSQYMAVAVWKCPILLDACASEMQRKGDVMMSKWAEIMTGMQPKTYFLQPHVALPLGIAVAREFFKQKARRRRPGRGSVPLLRLHSRCALLSCSPAGCAPPLSSTAGARAEGRLLRGPVSASVGDNAAAGGSPGGGGRRLERRWLPAARRLPP